MAQESTVANPKRIESSTVKAQFLQDMVGKSISRAQMNRLRNQRRASFVRVTTILASTVVTILLGLQIANAEVYFKQIAFVLGAVVTLLNALEPFFNYRALWVEHEQALAGFYQVKADLDFYLSGAKPEEIDSATLEDFHRRHQQVWDQLSKAWIGYRKSGTPEPENNGTRDVR